MAKQTFTTGQVLTAAQMTSLQQTAMGGGSATAKTATYVLVAADAGTTVAMNAAGATTITVNTSLFAAGDSVYIQNLGAGVTTITPGTATVNSSASLALAQYEGGQLYFTSASASIFIKGAGAGAASGLTKIASDTFSNVASVTVDDVFSATYRNYMLVLNIYATTRANDLYLKLRFGSSTRTASYYSSAFRSPPSNTQVGYGASAGGEFILSDNIGNSSEPSAFTLYFSKVGNASETPNAWGMGNIDGNGGVGFFGGWNEVAATYTGVVLSSSSSNIFGNYAFYGLAN